VTVRVVAFGSEATLGLASAVAEAQRADPLAPVTVVTPSNYAGLSVRRLLASTDYTVAGTATGIVNVGFATLFQVAVQVGTPEVVRTGKRPLSSAVLGAAIRSVLNDAPGYFAPVANHAATETAIERIFGELSRTHPETRARLVSAGSTQTRELLRLHDAITHRIDNFYDEDALFRAAIDVVNRGDAEVERLGTIIFFLPERLSPAQADFVDALVDQRQTATLLGVSGDTDGDAAAHALVRHIHDPHRSVVPSSTSDAPHHAPSPPAATSIIETADSDDEVRSVIRAIITRLELGIEAHRIAVYYPSADPYARALIEQLTTSKLPFNSASGRTLASSFAGRVLLRLVALASARDEDRQFSRDAIIDLATAGPLHGRNGALRSTRWDDLSRKAGVLGGIADWSEKLTRYRTTAMERIEYARNQERSDGLLAAMGKELDIVEDLLTFVRDLATQLGDLIDEVDRHTWKERARLFATVLDQLLPGEEDRRRWPDHESDALNRVFAVLDQLGTLDAFEAAPTAATFQRALTTELDTPSGRIGRFGDGITVAPLTAAAGLDFDVIFVVGMAEGLCPAPRRDDALLPDTERGLAAFGELELRTQRLPLDHRRYLAALASGRNERILLVPKGDHRNGRKRLPSRWLLDSASAMIGEPILGSQWPDATHDEIYRFDSFQHGLRASAAAASESEFELMQLTEWALAGQPSDQHPITLATPELRDGFAMIADRKSAELTRFDGFIGDHLAAGPVLAGGIHSATRLETWATCPMRYFFAYELGLGEIPRPERITDLSPLDQGNMMHQILEQFLQPIVDLDAADRPAPGTEWNDDDRQRLAELAVATFQKFEDDGLTGHELLWRLRRERLARDLRQFVDMDSELRAHNEMTPEAVEMAIGIDGASPLTVTLDDGRTLSLRGFADRVDLDRDGYPVVIDYKSGRAHVSASDLAADPVIRGTKLQLAVYAEAARERFGADGASAWYWYTSESGSFGFAGYALTPQRRQRFLSALTSITEGIESGVFPMVSGDYNDFFQSHENCRFCDFDDICPRDRHDQSARKVNDQRSEVFVELGRYEP